jgi:hypothetical protein
MAFPFIPLAIGGLSALSSGLQAFGADQSQRDGIRASNRAAQRDFRYRSQLQAFERSRAIEEYNIKVGLYEQEKQAQYEALGKNYNALQRQLDNAYRTAFYEEQNEAIQLAKSIGSASTRGMSGVSASRVDREPYAERGRNQAIRAQNLLESGYQYKDRANILRDQAYSNVRRAYGSVAIAPKFGPNIPEPVLQSQPNRFGLYSGLLGAAVGGFNTFSSFAPEGNFMNFFRTPKVGE